MEKAKEWGEVMPPSEVVDPIIFHFRPNKILAISPEHRADFERFFEENVGFPPPSEFLSEPPSESPSQSSSKSSSPRVATSAMRMVARYPNGGISGSNGGWDD
jgi:hypothetical protein